jgi:hypothetical protein
MRSIEQKWHYEIGFARGMIVGALVLAFAEASAAWFIHFHIL